jgi:DNA invertase Pin-like site-specific DNA recombinase
MYSYLSKKSEQAKAAIDYLEDRITGNQLIAIFNEEVKFKRRRLPHRAFPKRDLDITVTRREGHARAASRRDTIDPKRLRLTGEQIAAIRTAAKSGKSFEGLASELGISATSVRRLFLGHR